MREHMIGSLPHTWQVDASKPFDTWNVAWQLMHKVLPLMEVLRTVHVIPHNPMGWGVEVDTSIVKMKRQYGNNGWWHKNQMKAEGSVIIKRGSWNAESSPRFIPLSFHPSSKISLVAMSSQSIYQWRQAYWACKDAFLRYPL